MALAWLLSRENSITALIVDHGLRAESAKEAEKTFAQLKRWKNVDAHILNHNEERPKSKIQEWARDLRYRLMADFCKTNDISNLAIAHHMDDQAETFLFRLAKGSGLKGLSCMKAQGELNGITILRPLLDVQKSDLIDLCVDKNIEYIKDPSNENLSFARVRLRMALEAEGASAKRLSKTAKRLARADGALEEIASANWQERAEINGDKISINLKDLHEEVALRLLLKAINIISPSKYGVRLSKLEDLLRDVTSNPDFKRRTLGGVVFSVDGDSVILVKELF